MIKGLGTDLVEVARMAQKIVKPGFLNIAFSESEIDYCNNKKYPAQHFAARFAAKEAYMKAIGTGWSDTANFNEIEIRNNTESKPSLHLSGATLSFFSKSRYKKIFVSMSHTSTMSNATIIITA